MRALKASSNTKLEKFCCRYNDIESRECASQCLEILLAMDSLQTIEFTGNVESKKFQKEWIAKFGDRKITFTEEEEGSDDDADDMSEEEDEGFDEDKLAALCSKFEELSL